MYRYMERVDERKEKLGNLFNISDIGSCNTIYSKLTRYINNSERTAKAASLKEEIATLRDTLQAEAGIIEYKKLSTTDVQPGWDKESRVGTQLRFLTAEKSEHDAVMSMSSGQVSALSLAFFLSLNKVYARVPLILIDDPSQSLDEVNVASLTDLLRCELKHCQLVVSSHEDDISAYMRYRFDRADLTTSSLNMQLLAKEAS